MNVALKLAMACLTLALVLPVAARAAAQGGGGMQGMQMPTPDERLANLSSKLNLTDDQKAKIKPILEDEATKMQALHDDTSTPRMQKMQKGREIHDAHDQQINAILTPDQQAKYAEMKKEAMEKMREKRGQTPPQQ